MEELGKRRYNRERGKEKRQNGRENKWERKEEGEQTE